MRYAVIGALCAATSTVGAQAASEVRAVLTGGFAEVSAWITQSADIVPAERYTYRPVATVRTFGELVAHVADGYNWYCANASGKKTEWSDAIEKGRTDKTTVVAKLKQATDACSAATATGQVRELIQNIAHASLHYGNIVTYLRMMGLVPPSS